jgi:hypothetical protein
MERAMGIEPTSEAWEACNITQKHAGLAAFLQFSERLNWKIMENGNDGKRKVVPCPTPITDFARMDAVLN